jgi:hypothetical protein
MARHTIYLQFDISVNALVIRPVTQNYRRVLVYEVFVFEELDSAVSAFRHAIAEVK